MVARRSIFGDERRTPGPQDPNTGDDTLLNPPSDSWIPGPSDGGNVPLNPPNDRTTPTGFRTYDNAALGPSSVIPNTNPSLNHPTTRPARVSGGYGEIDPAKGDLAGQISTYFKDRGVSDSETSYWVSKWPELVARGAELGNPDYAMQRLAAADVFGGKSATGGGSGGGAGTTAANNQLVFSSLPDIQVGTDPLSQAIDQSLMQILQSGGHVGGNTEALSLENARQAADRARKAEMEGVMGQLASRGVLPENETGGMGGLALDALGRVERNDIAPLYWNAVRDYMVKDNEQSSANVLNAISQGTTRQNALSQIALQNLAQNVSFNEFLATYGLDRDKTLAELASGTNTSLLGLLTAYLSAARTSAGGYI